MSRNSKSSIIKTSSGKRRYASAGFPDIPIQSSDIYIVTTSTERLDKLASNFYDNSEAWWIIAYANNIGKGTIYVEPNTRLRIPSKNTINDLL